MSDDEPLPTAWRVICTADADGVRVVRRRRVHATTPPSEAIGDDDERSGFWVEVRGADGRVQYRQAMSDPREEDLEAPGDPEHGGLTRRRVPGPRTFAMLVPETPDADHVALLSAAPVPGGRARPHRTELARIPLREDAPSGDSEEGT